jgi:hypothetical protein
MSFGIFLRFGQMKRQRLSKSTKKQISGMTASAGEVDHRWPV